VQAAGDKVHTRGPAITGVYRQAMMDEVEVHLEHPLSEGNCRRGQTARGQFKRDIPPIVQERRQLQLDLADDLRPHVQCRVCVSPRLQRQLRPSVLGHTQFHLRSVHGKCFGKRARMGENGPIFPSQPQTETTNCKIPTLGYSLSRVFLR